MIGLTYAVRTVRYIQLNGTTECHHWPALLLLDAAEDRIGNALWNAPQSASLSA